MNLIDDLRAMRQMCLDAIAEGSPETPKLRVVLAEYETKLARMERLVLPTNPAITDDVPQLPFAGGSGQKGRAMGRKVRSDRPTDKALNFLRSLVDTRDPGKVEIPANLDNISARTCSALIDQLVDRPRKTGAPAAYAPKMANEKQLGFVRSLLEKRDATGLDVPADLSTLTSGAASKLIDDLKGRPFKAVAAKSAVELPDGIYRVGDEHFMVYRAVHGSGRMVCKQLVGAAPVVKGEKPTGEWEYRGLAARFVKLANRLSDEDAAAFGQIYGYCGRCGRTLTNEVSKTNGIGPECAKKGL